jgi:hypothetical protein
MNIIRQLCFAFIIMIGFWSCNSSSMRIMATWIDKKDSIIPQPGRHKTFIFAMTQNYEAELTLETDLAEAAAAKGVLTVKCIDAFGPILSVDKLPKKDVFLKAIRDLGCDYIFTIAVVDQQSQTHYVPPTASSVYTPYSGYGYYYSGYYAWSPTVYSPGYYSTDHTYFIESNLFDANTEKMLISMQSKVVNPPEITKASKKYTNMLVTELQAHGLMK